MEKSVVIYSSDDKFIDCRGFVPVDYSTFVCDFKKKTWK